MTFQVMNSNSFLGSLCPKQSRVAADKCFGVRSPITKAVFPVYQVIDVDGVPLRMAPSEIAPPTEVIPSGIMLFRLDKQIYPDINSQPGPEGPLTFIRFRLSQHPLIEGFVPFQRTLLTTRVLIHFVAQTPAAIATQCQLEMCCKLPEKKCAPVKQQQQQQQQVKKGKCASTVDDTTCASSSVSVTDSKSRETCGCVKCRSKASACNRNQSDGDSCESESETATSTSTTTTTTTTDTTVTDPRDRNRNNNKSGYRYRNDNIAKKKQYVARRRNNNDTD